MVEKYGLKIGSNVSQNTLQQLRLSTKESTLKTFKWGTARFVTNGSGVGSVDIPHGLGSVATAAVFRKFTAQYSFLSSDSFPNAYHQVGTVNSYATDGYFDFYVDETNLHIFTSTDFSINGSLLPNHEYEFQYLLFVDPSQVFNNQFNISLSSGIGFKSAKTGKNVFTDKEFDMNYSSKYRAIQYYKNHLEVSNLTLPVMQASLVDTSVNEATYVDFEHQLGYPPLFFIYSNVGGSTLYEVPYIQVSPALTQNQGYEEISAWCNSERIRVLYHRNSTVITGSYGQSYSAATVSVNILIFAENLLFPRSS